MADSDIPIDQANALNKALRDMGTNAQGFANKLSASTNITKDLGALFGKVADNMKRTDDYTVDLLDRLTKVGSITGKIVDMYDDEDAVLEHIIYLAKTNEKIMQSMQDMLSEELQIRKDLLLQTTMLETGLEGVYAQMATTLKLEAESIENNAELINLTSQLNDLKKEGNETSDHGVALEEQIVKLTNELLADQKKEYDSQVKMLQNRQAQNKLVEKQVSFTKQVAAETLKIKEQTDAYKKKFEGFLATTKAIFSSPAAFATVAIAALEKIGSKFSETFKSIRADGMSLGQAVVSTFDAYSTSIAHLGTISVEQVIEAKKAITAMGGTLTDAAEGADKVADLMEVMGGNATDTGTAFGFLQTMPGQTKTSAENIMKMGSAMAKVANVSAATVTQAIAKNLELAAIAGPKLMKSFAEAAIFAKKIGVEMSVFGNMAKGLLSFEESINKQMEASVLLGREINLDKARELALAGDLKGVQHEILKVVGSEAEFNQMNFLQKQALAAAMNLEVTDLQKIIAGKGKETELGKKSLELEEEKSSLMNRIGISIMNNLSGFISGIAGAIVSLVSLVFQYKTLNLLKAQSTAVTAANTPVTTANAMSIRSAGVAAKGAAMSMLAFGAAVLMIGVGIGIAALGFAQLVKAFGETTNAGMALLAITVIMAGFAIMVNVLSGASLAAAPGLYLLGGAMLMIGGGIFLATAGMALLIYSLSKLNTEQLATVPMMLAAIVVPMTLLGVSFMVMASGLAAMAATSGLVMPLIGSLIMLAGVAAMLGQMGGLSLPSLGESDKKPAASRESSDGGSFKKVEDALVNLTTAVKGIRGDVILDGPKVGSAIWTYVQTKIVQEQTKTTR